jgi:hypothetical protein
LLRWFLPTRSFPFTLICQTNVSALSTCFYVRANSFLRAVSFKRADFLLRALSVIHVNRFACSNSFLRAL